MSITIAPAPNAAFWALCAVIVFTAPATIICNPPPALLVDIYMSTPTLSFAGVIRVSPSSIFRPDSSSSSANELSTPLVTSSKGASTVVGASPLKVWRYSLPFFSISIAFVVVLPQSVAIITLKSLGIVKILVKIKLKDQLIKVTNLCLFCRTKLVRCKLFKTYRKGEI